MCDSDNGWVLRLWFGLFFSELFNLKYYEKNIEHQNFESYIFYGRIKIYFYQYNKETHIMG